MPVTGSRPGYEQALRRRSLMFCRADQEAESFVIRDQHIEFYHNDRSRTRRTLLAGLLLAGTPFNPQKAPLASEALEEKAMRSQQSVGSA